MKSQYKYANDSGQFLYEGLSFIFNHHHIKHINNIAPCQKTSRELPFGHKDYLLIISFLFLFVVYDLSEISFQGCTAYKTTINIVLDK